MKASRWLNSAIISVAGLFSAAGTQAKEHVEPPELSGLFKGSIPSVGLFDIEATSCDPKRSDTVAHQILHKIILEGQGIDTTKSPKEIQEELKKTFEKQKAFLEKILGNCTTENSQAIQEQFERVKKNPRDKDAFNTFINLAVINNYTDIAAYYDDEFFKGAIRTIMKDELKSYADTLARLKITDQILDIENKINQSFQDNKMAMIVALFTHEMSQITGARIDGKFGELELKIRMGLKDMLDNVIREKFLENRPELFKQPHYDTESEFSPKPA